MSEHFYITTPIYYVNDKPHIGHAYTSVACDALARFKRLDGYDVKFLTGTDEHGQKVEQSAAKAGLTPQEYADMVSDSFRELTYALNLSNDDFIRTTEARHKKAAHLMWERLLAKGDIYLGSYSGWYSVRDEAFYGEDELIDGFAPTGAPVEWVEEPSYFFKLSAYGDKLLEFFEANPDFISPASRKSEVVGFIKGGLRDLSISRTTFTWGVSVPNDPAHIMYVWLDALVNYLTAVGFADEGSTEYSQFWPADVHVVGKDIMRFHAIYWPAFLMSADVPLPKKVYAHGWWTNEGQKISKSLGNVIKPETLIDVYGLDQTRYFLLREVPFGSDGNFSRAAMVQRINSELANTIGNLAQRSLSMIYKHCAAKLPVVGAYNAVDDAMLAQIYAMQTQFRAHMNSLAFHLALEVIVDAARKLNEYIDVQAPWTLRKTDEARMNTVLYVIAEGLRCIAIALQPFVPASAAELLDQLSVYDDDGRSIKAMSPDHALKSGTPITEPKGVFPRFDVVDD
jgi:methionyl-tRNA synthetase